MKTLGFAIKLASQGAGNAIECNKGEWTNKVVDIREYLKLFEGLQDTDNIVTFISFDENGCFLTQLRAISGRGGDFLSGWIYIPNTLNITGEDIINTYNYVRGILKQSNLSKSKDEIHNFFSKEYVQKEAKVSYIPSSGEKYGVRFIGHFSLKEIIGTNRYQPYYSKYKAVFLLENNNIVTISKGYITNFEDLTKQPIVETGILKAPTAEDMLSMGRDVKIIFENGNIFKSPLLVRKGDSVKLLAQRSGFESIKLPTITINEEVTDFPHYETLQWKKLITTASFIVKDNEGKPLNNPKIYIDNNEIPFNGILLDENRCRNVEVKVTCQGYESYEKKVNLLQIKVSVVLERETKGQKYDIILSNGHHAKMTLESKYLNSSSSRYDSPIDAYSYNEEKRALSVSSWFVWKQRLYGLFCGFLILLMIAGGMAFEEWWNSVDCDMEWPFIHPKQKAKNLYLNKISYNEPSKESNTTIDNSFVVAYLDNNETWCKDSLEKFSATTGLFDDLNSFHFDNIISKFESQLNASSKMSELVKAVKKCKELEFDPHKGKKKNGGTYNKDSDRNITVNSYIDWITTKQVSTDEELTAPKDSSKTITKRLKTVSSKTDKTDSKEKKKSNRGSAN